MNNFFVSIKFHFCVYLERRDIGVKDLGTPECQGMLYRRLRGSVSGAQWVKGWFMLKGTTFYGFKSKEVRYYADSIL